MSYIYIIETETGEWQNGWLCLPLGWVVVGSTPPTRDVGVSAGDVEVNAVMHRSGCVVSVEWRRGAGPHHQRASRMRPVVTVRLADGTAYERVGTFRDVINEIDIALGGTGREGIRVG